MPALIRSLAEPSIRPTYTLNLGSITPTGLCLGVVEAGPNKVLRLACIRIFNPGQMTTAGLVTLSLVRTGAPSTGGSSPVAAKCDPRDPPFSGVCRTGCAVPANSVLAGDITIWIPSAYSSFDPLDLPMGGMSGVAYKPPTALPGQGIALFSGSLPGAAGFWGHFVFTEDDN